MQIKRMQEAAQKLSEDLADTGKLIDGEFAGFRLMVISDEAPPSQVHEMRMAFFAGAQHIFAITPARKLLINGAKACGGTPSSENNGKAIATGSPG